jgi:hypothetical protein
VKENYFESNRKKLDKISELRKVVRAAMVLVNSNFLSLDECMVLYNRIEKKSKKLNLTGEQQKALMAHKENMKEKK